MYATRDDLIARFGTEVEQLESMHPQGNTAVQSAIQDATEEIDGYLAGRYDLPLPNVPNNLKRLACDIARYYLYFQQPTELVEKRYEQAIDYLKMVANNKAHLSILDNQNQITEEKPQNSPVTAPVGTTYTGGVFGDDVLNKMPSL